MDKNRAFTIIEFMVVIAVLALLAGILIPAVKSARKAGMQATLELPPKDWPEVSGELNGSIEVRIKNPNRFRVRVGLRSGGKGRDFIVQSNSTESVHVPNGQYDIYFQYSSNPDSLYQGDSFALDYSGVEIQIVEVVNGNYRINKVK